MEEDFQTLKKNFNSLVTFDYKHRMEQLDILQKMLNENKEKVKKNNFLIFFQIFSALDSDLKQTHLLKWNEGFSNNFKII
jgi:hypothetical protein